MKRNPVLLILLLFVTGATWAKDKPVKIYVFAGQSNMESRYPRKFLEEKHPELVKSKNVWHVSGPNRGPIEDGKSFGADRAMVYTIADKIDQPIIVFRCAFGGTALYKKWRPPSTVKREGGEVGVLYKKLVSRFHNLVANLKEVYPAYKGRGYEVAAFVWFQGESDSCQKVKIDDQTVGAWRFYEQNLRDLITDVRRDFGTPNLPVMIPQINVSEPWEMNKDVVKDDKGNEKKVTAGDIVRLAQLEVAESVPGCKWVPTKGLSTGYHYDANAYVVIGKRMGEAMLPLAKKVQPTDPAKIAKARSKYLAREFKDLKPNIKSLTKGVICYFPFDEGKGTNVTSRSGKNLKGSLVTTGKEKKYTPIWVDGVRGKALKFMASNHVMVPGYQDPVNKDGKIDTISVSYWLNKTATCGYGGQIARRKGKELGWWIDERHNGNWLNVHFVTEKGPYDEFVTWGGPRTRGDGFEWIHVAVVFDGPNKRFDYYFNGKKMPPAKKRIEVDGKKKWVAKRPESWQILAAAEGIPLRIGEQGWFGSMKGPLEAQSIDEVIIWNRALTEKEIQMLYNNGNAVAFPKKR